MKREEGMKGLRAVLMFGLLAMIPMGCSDNDSGSSPVPPSVPTNRIYILNADGANLVPATEATGDTAVSDSQQSWEYTLTLENVSDDIFWFTERPERNSGNETTEDFFQTVWPAIYVEIAPNSILDGTIPPNILRDGLFLMLQDPEYNPALKQVVFNVTLQNSTMDDKHPASPVSFENVKLTIGDNNLTSGVVEWSFAQVGPLATLVPEGTDGKYILSFENIYPECYYMSLAPDRYSFTYTVAMLTDTWKNQFGDVPPNASITSYNSDGELQVNAFSLENPVYDSESGLLTYTATILSNGAEPDEYLYSPTLFIDGSPTVSCKSGFTGRLSVQNGSTESIWIVPIFPNPVDGAATVAQWDWWKDLYGEQYEIPGGSPGKVFCIPDGGAPSGKFYFLMGCDSSGKNCKIGSQEDAMAGVQTYFEASFGCKFNTQKEGQVDGCAFNPSGKDQGGADKWPDCIGTAKSKKTCPSVMPYETLDLSTVDGYTLPMIMELTGTSCKDNNGPTTKVDASMLDIASCPSDGKATLYSDNEQQNELIQKGAGINWLTKKNTYYQGCVAPCHWFMTTGVGEPVNPDPSSPLPTVEPWIAASYYCCIGSPGPGDGSGKCAEGPKNGNKTYPITLTNYVKNLKAVGYRGYSWQFDDLAGTVTCDWGEQIKLNVVPNGGVPYDPATKWSYTGGKCKGGKTGDYSSLLECQQKNMKYKCHAEAYATGPTVNYCIVDPQGTKTWDECQSTCKN
jgi:hypothetical protein